MKINLVTLCSGIEAQGQALRRLCQDYPELEWELLAWSEIDRDAIKAHDAVFPEYADRNLGDMTKADYSRITQPIDCLFYSTPCFVAGTLIQSSHGYIPIENVAVGDMVLTHTNSFQKVLAVGSRQNAPIVKVRGMTFKDIECTPNHPFYARIRYKEWNNAIRQYERKFTDPEWVNADSLTKSHYLGYAINRKSEIPKWCGAELHRGTHYDKVDNLTKHLTSYDFWYIMGRYVGDGWLRQDKNHKAMIVCCSERNIESLRTAIKRVGWNYTETKERTTSRFTIYSVELCAFAERYGKGADSKFIDEETINLPHDYLNAFVNGYIDADGHFDKKENSWGVTSVSKKLIYSIQQCIAKVFKCPVRMYYADMPKTTVIEGRVVNQKSFYRLVWHEDKRKQDKAFYEDGFVWFPVKEVVRLDKTATVYNMEVENDNSYTANGAIVHNCQSVSQAGRNKGMAEGTDAASALIWHTKRAIESLKPKVCILENVKGMTMGNNLKEFHKWQRVMEDYGYTNFCSILDSQDYGVPQHRERLFMVSILDCDKKFHFPKPFKLEKRIKDILEPYGSIDESYYFSAEKLKKVMDHCDRKVAEGCGFKNQFFTEDGVSTCDTSRYSQRETDPYLKEGVSIDPISRRMEFKGYSSIQSDTTPCLAAHDGKGAPVLYQRLSLYENNSQTGRIYDENGICPCLQTLSAPIVITAVSSGTEYVKSPMIGNDPRRIFGQSLFYEDVAPTLMKQDSADQKILKEPIAVNNNNISTDKIVLSDEDGRGYLWQDNMLWRIRCLTPMEVFRLQDVSDEDAKKIIEVCCKTCSYALAGNSITIAVIYNIFKCLWKDTEDQSNQKSLFDI